MMNVRPRAAAILSTTLVLTAAALTAAQSQRPPVTATAAKGSWTPARTPWGDPDLQGKWFVAETATPLERPAAFANREFLTDEEVAKKVTDFNSQAAPEDSDAEIVRQKQPDHEKGIRGEEYNRFWLEPLRAIPWNRTSLIVDPPDGRIPPLTPEAIARIEARENARRGRGEADTWADRNVSERCLLPAFIRFDGPQPAALSVREILQAPGYVAIMINLINSNDPLLIPLDGRPRPGERLRTWFGIPRGHWEGNTLVVETTHINDRQDGGAIMPSRSPFTQPGTGGGGGQLGSGDTLRIVERFTRVAADRIEYRFTIEDPKTYVRPFTVLRPFIKAPDDLLMPENGCHEGNYGIVGQLSAGRADEEYALKAAQVDASARTSRLQEMKRRTDEWIRSQSKR